MTCIKQGPPVSNAGSAFNTKRGVGGISVTSSDLHGGAVDATDAPTQDLSVVVDDIVVGTAANMSVTFTEEGSADTLLQLFLAANSTVHFRPQGKFKLPTANKKLQVVTSAAGAVAVTVLYHSE